MRGDVDSIMGTFTASAFGILLAVIIGSMCYLFMDILTDVLTEQNPALLAIQLAGATAAVSSAPNQATYCFTNYPIKEMSVYWIKPYSNSSSGILIPESPTVPGADMAQMQLLFRVGALPISYPMAMGIRLRKDVENIILIRKTNNMIKVNTTKEKSDCEVSV